MASAAPLVAREATLEVEELRQLDVLRPLVSRLVDEAFGDLEIVRDVGAGRKLHRGHVELHATLSFVLVNLQSVLRESPLTTS